MSRVLLLLCALSLSACHQANNSPKKNPAETTRPDAFDRLLARFEPISFDTLFVYPAGDHEEAGYRYNGKPLTASEIALLPEEIIDRQEDGVYACFRFALDKNREALITRVPSTYEPSAIRLLLYDRRRKKIEGYHDLADTFGDAGDFSEKYSWLFRDKKGTLYSFMWMPDSYNHQAEDERDSTIDIGNEYFLIQHTGARPDTLSSDSTALPVRFASLLQRAPQPWPQVRWNK